MIAPSPQPPSSSRADRLVLDVSRLPKFAFGHQGLIWWGTIGFMVIEGSMFIMVFITYFFLRTRESSWPPGVPLPDASFGTINTIILLASAIPNHMAKIAAEKFQVNRIRVLMPIVFLFGIAFLIVRVFEFGSLGVRWDTNAYGSIVWFIMGLHTSHVLTDVADTAVLGALLFTAHVEPKRLVDVSENALYWDFVILTWIPVFLTIYFAPRWL
jgi:cytochrome c oxidase subunit III